MVAANSISKTGKIIIYIIAITTAILSFLGHSINLQGIFTGSSLIMLGSAPIDVSKIIEAIGRVLTNGKKPENQ